MFINLILCALIIGILSLVLHKLNISHCEQYRVTLNLPEWQKWVADGKNTLYGDAIISGGTVNTGWGGNGAVYRGHVRQGIGMA